MRYRFTDHPGPDRPHERPTPLLGGIAVVGAFLVASALTGMPQVRLIAASAALLVLG